MKKAGFPGSHPDERTLVSLCNNRLENAEQVEDHVMLCGRCLDKVEKIDLLIQVLRLASVSVEKPRHMTAGSYP